MPRFQSARVVSSKADPTKNAAVIVWDANRVEVGLIAVSHIRAPFLLHVKVLLDEYHGVQRPIEYYDVLLGDWVEQILHLVYFAFSDVSEQEVDPPARREVRVAVPPDSRSFTLRAVEEPEQYETLKYLVFRLMGSTGLPPIVLDEVPVHGLTQGIRTKTMAAIQGMVAPKKPEILICSPYIKCSKGEWFSAVMRWRQRVRCDDLAYPIRWSASCDRSWRMSHAGLSCNAEDNLAIAKALASLYIPKVFLEGLSSYREQVMNLGIYRPKAVYSANGLNWHISFKILAAEWREQGTKLLYHQHGGGYGVDKENILEDYEVRVSDRYYTWGWRHPSATVKPLSPPPVVTGGFFPAQRKHEILLVCLETPKLPYRLWYQPMPGTMELVIRETAEFVAKLRRPTDLLVRLAPKGFGWGMRDAIVSRVPSTRFDDFSVGSLKRFATSRLVIHNYLGTSWLETLALNLPTVCFYSPMIHSFRATTAPFINELERVGILHRSASMAAAFVQSIGRDVEVWWKGTEVQAARQIFVDNYAKFSSNWAAEWEAEFDSLPQA